jgi:hypothetical protein
MDDMTNNEPKAARPSDDAKARFREALEKKKQHQHSHNDRQGNAATGSVQGSETTGPTQKMFRRKAGG